MKKIASAFVAIIVYTAVSCAAPYVSNNTPILFGTVTYTTDNTGVRTITVVAHQTQNIGQISGSGNMYSPDLNVKRAIITIDNLGTTAQKHIDLRINTTGTADVSSAGCGTVRISNLLLENASTTFLNKSVSKSSNRYNSRPAGTVQLISVDSVSTCTISGVVPGAFGWKLHEDSTYNNEDIGVSLTVIGATSLDHDSGAELNFGTFCRSGQEQSLTITSAGTAESATMVCPATGEISADSFTFHNPDPISFSVSFPASSSLTNGNGDTLTVTNFTSSCSGGCTTVNGYNTFTVGGTLTVPANSSPGDYVGNYSVTVTY